MKNYSTYIWFNDSEHDISIKSAMSVFENFPTDHFNVLPIYIQKRGSWVSGNYFLEILKSHFPAETEYVFKFSAKDKGLF